MKTIIVEGQTMLVAETTETFNCYKCALHESHCVRIDGRTKELYFDRGPEGDKGSLYCINQERDVVFVANTPEAIADYVASRME